MPTAIELFVNPPTSAATVATGGTTAPASGTSQTFTMAGGYAQYPAASNAAVPPTQFHIYDPLLPSEIMLVTNVSGTSWTVTRGAENTTPVIHTAGFVIVQVVSALVLADFTQDTASIPASQADVTSHTISAVSYGTLTKSWPVPASDASIGTIYRLTAFGTGVMPATAGSFNFQLVAFGSTIINSKAGAVGLVQCGATLFPLSGTFDWNLTVYVVVMTTGATGTIAVSAVGAASIGGANLSATGGSSANGTAGIAGANATTTVSTVAAGNTIGLQAEWLTNAGSLVCQGSIFERIGT